MPFFTTRPTSRIRPHRRGDVQVHTGQPEHQERARERERRGQHNQRGWQPRLKVDDQNGKNQNDRQRENHQQLAERLSLRIVLSANLVGIADRQLELFDLRANLCDRAAEIAISEPPACRRRCVSGLSVRR